MPSAGLIAPSPSPPAWLDPALLVGQLAPRSLAGYRHDIEAYRQFCADPQAALSPAGLARWRAHLAGETGLSPHTINRRLAAVKRLVKEAAAQGMVDEAVASSFQRVSGVSVMALKGRLQANRRTRITPAEMRRLCEAPDSSTLLGLRDRALLATLATSGCRVSEVVGLTAAQILTHNGSYFLQVLGKQATEPRQAPLGREAHAHLQAWLARRPIESPFIFTSFGGRGRPPTPRPMDRSAAWRAVQRYAGRAGLAHVKPHDFRRFVGTELARRDLRQAQRALGHKRLETTVRHYVLDSLEGGLTDGLY